MHPKIRVSILAVVLLVTSLALISCGSFEDDNNQPSIGLIPDKTLDLDDKITVDVIIIDADIEDTHTINASSDDTTIATVSVNAASITITAKAEGMTTITVSATDDSGQDNAAATPVTFEVTVNPPRSAVTFKGGINQPPSSFIDKGVCTVGMTLQPGESCTYDSKDPFAEIVFSVLHDGTVCREQVPLFGGQIEIPEQLRPRNLKFCVEWDIERDDFFNTNFSASKNPAGSWTVENVP